MRLPFLRPREPKADRPRAATAADEPAVIAAARTRARQRLVGALVLLVIGVIGFPILFETQPRALPMNTPILAHGADVARPETAPTTPVAPPRMNAKPLPPADAGIEALPAGASAPPGQASGAAPAAASAAASAAARPVPAAVAAAPPKAVVPTRAASAPGVGASEPVKVSRFVVQVGAFSDATALREARQKVEKLGLSTYTQVIEAEGIKRTRVRVGPYATREEADAAAARLKRGGLAPAVLLL